MAERELHPTFIVKGPANLRSYGTRRMIIRKPLAKEWRQENGIVSIHPLERVLPGENKRTLLPPGYTSNG
jgi:hypothetical protein